MKKMLLFLVPFALFAQVVVDTVIPLPETAYTAKYIPELDKLYIDCPHELLVLDCSNYQIAARIPTPYPGSYTLFTWNPLERKLYVNADPLHHNLLVVDVTADTLLPWTPTIHVGPNQILDGIDNLLYLGLYDTIYVVDCSADTIVRRVPSPFSGFRIIARGWTPKGNKLYAGMGVWGSPPYLAVYDCGADSFTRVLDITPNGEGVGPPVFNYRHSKAYFTHGGARGGNACVLDMEADTVLRYFPTWLLDGTFLPIALDTIDDKVYITGNCTQSDYETLYVIDCVTDSIIRKVPYNYSRWGAMDARWVPWSNRLYFWNQGDTAAMVLDCSTDSIIVPQLHLARWAPGDVQLDPVGQRIFAVGCDMMAVHVLRDVVPGVAEKPARGATPAASVRVRDAPGEVAIEYSISAACPVEVKVFDLAGRTLRTLVSGIQDAGSHKVSWDRTLAGRRAPSGVYFITVAVAEQTHRAKVAVR